jgi:hypothetical protein
MRRSLLIALHILAIAAFRVAPRSLHLYAGLCASERKVCARAETSHREPTNKSTRVPLESIKLSLATQVSIQPPSNISNDIAYTWHGSTDLYLIGENQSRMCRKVSFNSEGNSKPTPI